MSAGEHGTQHRAPEVGIRMTREGGELYANLDDLIEAYRGVPAEAYIVPSELVEDLTDLKERTDG